MHFLDCSLLVLLKRIEWRIWAVGLVVNGCGVDGGRGRCLYGKKKFSMNWGGFGC